MRLVEILQRILQVACPYAPLGHGFRVHHRGTIGLPAPFPEHLRHPQHGPHAVGELFVVAPQDALEQGHGASPVAARQVEEAKLRRRKQVAFVHPRDGAELFLRFALPVHPQQQVGQLSP